MQSLFAVDVGMNALGYAFWEKPKSAKPEKPCYAGIIKVPNKLIKSTRDGQEWIKRFEWLMLTFGGLFDEYKPDRLVLEWPEFRAGSAIGHAAAGRDNLSQLAFACGAHAMMAWLAGSTWDCTPELVPVSKWKGMLKKEVVTHRIKNAIGDTDKDGENIASHAWDAVGIGLHSLGFKLDGKWFL